MTGFFCGKAGTIHARPPKSSAGRAPTAPKAGPGPPVRAYRNGPRDPHMMSMSHNAFSHTRRAA